MKDPMLDEIFLHQLDQYPHKFVWAKIISLSWEEYPQEEITGKITAGSISVDGSSAVRRTCSLTMIAQDVQVNNFYWGLNTKFKVLIGLENHIDSSYPDVIWFKQGTFIISSFGCSLTTNAYTINIQGRDKMVMLNGEVGGVVPSSWDFGKIRTTNPDGSYSTELYPIKDIILQAVHEYSQEPWQNIIVNDLDDYGIELLEYKGDSPIYFLIAARGSSTYSREVSNITMNGDMKCSIRYVHWNPTTKHIDEDENTPWLGDGNIPISALENIQDSSYWPIGVSKSDVPKYCYEKFLEPLDPKGDVIESADYYPVVIRFENDQNHSYRVAKVTNSIGTRICGYRLCDIVYPYDLIASPGDTITVSVLDKLVQMLGNFEYFYDIDGRFIFQKKRTFSDVSYNNIKNEHSITADAWADSSKYSSIYTYTFDDNTLVSAIQNSPDFSTLKNDFSLWGQRSSSKDASVPIHLRYALDHKPWAYRVLGYGHDGTEHADEWFISEEGKTKMERLVALRNQELRATGQQELEGGWTTRIKKYRKTPNTNGLPETWWEVQDWARYYGTIAALQDGQNPDALEQRFFEAQYYPKQWLMYYKSVQDKDLPTYKTVYDYIGGRPPTYNANTKIQMIIQTADGNWTSHGANCSHAYTWFLTSIPVGAKAYVYKPTFPGEIQYSYESGETTGDDAIVEIDLSKYLNGAVHEVDWREIIFQMAQDYRRHYRDADFLIKVRDNNMVTDMESIYPTGYTNYEKYYVDFEMNASQSVVAYWRELYNPEFIGSPSTGVYKIVETIEEDGSVHKDTVWQDDASLPEWSMDIEYSEGDRIRIQDENQIYHVFKSLKNHNLEINPFESTGKKIYWVEDTGVYHYNTEGWNPNILNNPENLNFWFDFLDTEGELNKYSVNNIGQRSKAVNDDKIKAIYFREVPNIIFEMQDDVKTIGGRKPGYSYVNIPPRLNSLFTLSSRGKSATDVIEEYLYAYTYPASSMNLTTIPIYYLQPNTLIYVNDAYTGTVGEYMLQRYSIQLGSSGQMSITAVQTAKRIY